MDAPVHNASPAAPRHVYPSARTGTAQDLMRVVTKAYEDRLAADGTVLPSKTELERRFLEPVARAVGIAAGALLETLPAEWALAWHDRLFQRLSGERRYPLGPCSPAIAEARALSARLERESGRAPALLAAISHPPSAGDLAHLNLALARHASLALRRVRGRPCRPRFVAAVDPFALDSLGLIEEGLYAGFMGRYHLGLDRLFLGRSHPGPKMSSQTSWHRMPLRLFRTLSEGREVGMVLSGGVPSTARVLYGAREWARRARAAGPLRADPARAIARVRADAAFASFERSAGAHLPLPRGPWRLLEAWVMAAAAGLLPGQTAESAASAVLSCLDISGAPRASLLDELARDVTRETPARRRLFRLLVARVARRRPLMLIPVVHRADPAGVSVREAWGVTRLGDGRVRVVRAGSPSRSDEMTAEALAERFTDEHFA